MNQILSTGNNNNYEQSETKKIIVFFSIAIIIIALAIALVAFINYRNRMNSKVYDTPQIEITRSEGDMLVKIVAYCQDGIDLITYSWNDQDEQKIFLKGKTSFERIIDIPLSETNNIKVEVKSVTGVVANAEENYSIDVDLKKPVIDEIAIIDSKLHIRVSDDKALNYLMYQWEDEAEVKVEPSEEDKKTITTDIDIQRGTYKLTIKVYDAFGNKEETSKLITGVNEPEITAVKYGGKVRITVTHDRGFKQIEYEINDELYVYDASYSGYDEEKTTVELSFPLSVGENLVKVRAYSLEKLSPNDEDPDNLENYSSKIFTGKCTYEQ